MVPSRTRPAVAVLFLLAGCAPQHPAPLAAAPAPVAPGRLGVIVAERALRPDAAGMRSTILATLGDAQVRPVAAVPEVEFIVREDDGQTLSVVQDNPQQLRPGERVAVSGGAQTRLVRPVARLAAAPGG